MQIMRFDAFRWESGSPTAARAWNALFGMMISVFLAAIYLIARVGFRNPLQPVLAILTLGICFSAVPFFLHLLFRHSEREFSWTQSESFFSLILVGITALAGWGSPQLGVSFFPVIAGLAVLISCWLVGTAFPGTSHRRSIYFLAATFLFCIWVAGVVWANGFLRPLLLEDLIMRGGNIHIDTWYLGAISNMAQLHGVPSVGLDGLRPLQYHYGSNWMFGQFANVVGVSVLDFYVIGTAVVIVPLFFRSILTCACDLAARSAQLEQRSLSNSPLPWLILAAATIGVLPPPALHSVAIWASGPILSESYDTAVALCLFLIGTAGVFWRGRTDSNSGPERASDWTFSLFFVPLGLAAIGMVKVSQMILLTGISFWIAIRYSLWRKPVAVVSLIATVALVVSVYAQVAAPDRSGGIAPLSFLRLLPLSSWVFFPFLHLFWTWLYAFLRLRQADIQSFDSLMTAFRQRRLVDVEVVVLLAVAGQIPGNLLNIGSNQYYFSDFQRWVSIALLLGSPVLLNMLGRAGNLLRRDSTSVTPLSRTVLMLASVPLVATLGITSMVWGARLIHDNLATRREIQRIAGTLPATGIAGGFKQALTTALRGSPMNALSTYANSQFGPVSDRFSNDRALRASPRFPVVTALQQLGERSVNSRRQAIIFVQPDVKEFWGALRKAPCIHSAMLAPAIAGMPLLDGVPPNCSIPVFAFGHGYRELSSWQTPSSASDALLCERARKRGFRQVIRIAPTPRNQVTVRDINCPAG